MGDFVGFLIAGLIACQAAWVFVLGANKARHAARMAFMMEQITGLCLFNNLTW